MIRYQLLLIFIILCIKAAAQFSDDFSDGDFTKDPKWTGDTGKFEINSAKQLHLVSVGANISSLVTESNCIDNSAWSFWIDLAFNTSTNNYARVYLTSDNENLKGSLNGYFLQIGGSNDSVYFMRQNGMQISKLFNVNNISTNSSSNIFRFRMIHDSAGLWTLFTDSTGGFNFTETGHCIETSLHSSSWFGVSCVYTTSNATKFYFDDFSAGIIRTDSNYKAKPFDIVIDEIMADPDPVVELPDCEYVELYNRTSFPINLAGWKFEYGSSSKTLPSVIIASHGYLILAKDSLMDNYGTCVAVFTSNSSLSNEGTTLILRNSDGKVIHSVSYTSDWYADNQKEIGGWSLEMIDPGNPCGCKDNWKASRDARGGTPGSLNSINASNPDEVQPYMVRASTISGSIIQVDFSEAMDSLTLKDSKWSLDGEIFTPDRLSLIPPDNRSVLLTLSDTLKKSHVYLIGVGNQPTDCVGNKIDTTKKIRTGRPDSILPGDIIINEVLMNPKTGGEKFVELFNRSDNILNLQELDLGKIDSVYKTEDDLKSLSDKPLLSFPGDYSVLTKDPEDIQTRYYCPDPEAFVSMSSFPVFKSDNGTVVLTKISDGSLIDRLTYSTEMYSDLLTSDDGVSLERINPDLPTSYVTNWHSASESCGFATPGYRNSEFIAIGTGKDEVSISPEVFTPDDDGKDDDLLIQFELSSPGYLANIMIYDVNGNKVRCLSKNMLLSAEDLILWDGRNDNHQKSAVGIYIIVIELVDPGGKVVHFKKTCVLGGIR